MNNALVHETLFRGDDIKKINKYEYCVFGCGSLGEKIACGLARHGAEKFILIDMDRINDSNLGTQDWFLDEIGALKAQAVGKKIYRINKSKPEVFAEEFTAASKKIMNKILSFKKPVVIDAFDNFKSRKLVQDFVRKNNIVCIHAGMTQDGYGAALWDEKYSIPDSSKGGIDICDYPLARNLSVFVSALCCEALIEFAMDNVKHNYDFTLIDKCLERF